MAAKKKKPTRKQVKAQKAFAKKSKKVAKILKSGKTTSRKKAWKMVK